MSGARKGDLSSGWPKTQAAHSSNHLAQGEDPFVASGASVAGAALAVGAQDPFGSSSALPKEDDNSMPPPETPPFYGAGAEVGAQAADIGTGVKEGAAAPATAAVAALEQAGVDGNVTQLWGVKLKKATAAPIQQNNTLTDSSPLWLKAKAADTFQPPWAKPEVGNKPGKVHSPDDLGVLSGIRGMAETTDGIARNDADDGDVGARSGSAPEAPEASPASPSAAATAPKEKAAQDGVSGPPRASDDSSITLVDPEVTWDFEAVEAKAGAFDLVGAVDDSLNDLESPVHAHHDVQEGRNKVASSGFVAEAEEDTFSGGVRAGAVEDDVSSACAADMANTGGECSSTDEVSGTAAVAVAAAAAADCGLTDIGAGGKATVAGEKATKTAAYATGDGFREVSAIATTKASAEVEAELVQRKAETEATGGGLGDLGIVAEASPTAAAAFDDVFDGVHGATQTTATTAPARSADGDDPFRDFSSPAESTGPSTLGDDPLGSFAAEAIPNTATPAAPEDGQFRDIAPVETHGASETAADDPFGDSDGAAETTAGTAGAAADDSLLGDFREAEMSSAPAGTSADESFGQFSEVVEKTAATASANDGFRELGGAEETTEASTTAAAAADDRFGDFGAAPEETIAPSTTAAAAAPAAADEGFGDFGAVAEETTAPSTTAAFATDDGFGDFKGTLGAENDNYRDFGDASPAGDDVFGDFGCATESYTDAFGDFGGASNTYGDDFRDFGGAGGVKNDDFGEFGGAGGAGDDGFGSFGAASASASGFESFASFKAKAAAPQAIDLCLASETLPDIMALKADAFLDAVHVAWGIHEAGLGLADSKEDAAAIATIQEDTARSEFVAAPGSSAVIEPSPLLSWRGMAAERRILESQNLTDVAAQAKLLEEAEVDSSAWNKKRGGRLSSVKAMHRRGISRGSNNNLALMAASTSPRVPPQ